jgi:hypothetical protein
MRRRQAGFVKVDRAVKMPLIEARRSRQTLLFFKQAIDAISEAFSAIATQRHPH